MTLFPFCPFSGATCLAAPFQVQGLRYALGHRMLLRCRRRTIGTPALPGALGKLLEIGKWYGVCGRSRERKYQVNTAGIPSEHRQQYSAELYWQTGRIRDQTTVLLLLVSWPDVWPRYFNLPLIVDCGVKRVWACQKNTNYMYKFILARGFFEVSEHRQTPYRAHSLRYQVLCPVFHTYRVLYRWSSGVLHFALSVYSALLTHRRCRSYGANILRMIYDTYAS